MTEQDEWGPWVAYNNEGYFPGVQLGMIAQIKGAWRGKVFTSEPKLVADPIMFSDIVLGEDEEILAFRVRKPRALRDLIELSENMPEEIDA